MIDIAYFGKKLKIQESPKSKLKKKKELFISIIKMYEACWEKSNKLYDTFGVNLINYEEDFFIIMENLIYLHFGELHGRLIIWYIYERIDMETGDISSIILENTDDKGITTSKEIRIDTAEDLWNFLETYKPTNNETNEK